MSPACKVTETQAMGTGPHLSFGYPRRNAFFLDYPLLAAEAHRSPDIRRPSR